MAYDALIFDLGGVIIPHDNEQLFRRLAGRCAAPGAMAWLKAAAQDERHGTGELAIPDLHRMLVEEIGYGGDWETFVQDWSSHLEIDWEMLGLAERLAASNRVLLFSNTNREHWEHVQGATDGRLGRFEGYMSHEIAAVKPHADAFRLVARLAGLDPGRCLFIDDRAENVEGAREAGFHAEVFVGRTQLEELLRAAGVTWPDTASLERTP
ncbi:MAG: HAD family phosphatase [Caulobacteraceae bacterium]